jgi:hypothetical protein
MVMESPWKKFLHTVLKEDFDDLLGEYYRLRHMFQEHGIKDTQLERGIGMTSDMYLQRDYLVNLTTKIKKELKKFGLIENESEFLDYLTEFFYKIDSETPLNK